MKMDRTVTAVVAVGLLGLTSAPVMAGHTAGIFDTPSKTIPAGACSAITGARAS